MSTFNFEFNGQKFEINAPTGATYEQAKAVFDQQTASGGLTGFRVGDVLSSATQAAGGLAAAQSQLTQSLAAATSQLPSGTNLSSLTASIGTLGQGAGTQVASALQGGAAAFNSLTTGASGATASISAALSGAGAGVSLPSVSAITGALSGAAARVGSLASTAVGTISGLIKGTPTAGINIADFAKQGPALGAIGSMSLPDVTGTLAQASKLVGQAAGTISNTLGAGKFGFDDSQLEQVGLIKPGTAAAFLAAGENDLTSVLKSPTVWTGKDGVKSLSGLLNNSGLQDKLQQGLMKSGLNDLKSLGIPTDKLTPQALSGLATNAAKSVSDTLDWAKNAPGLPADIKSKFDAAALSGAFAVNLTQTKIDPSTLQEYTPVAAENTVNSKTVDAAGARIVGNDKIPSVMSSSDNSSASQVVSSTLEFLRNLSAQAYSLAKSTRALVQQPSITQEQWNTVNSELQVIRATFNNNAIIQQKNAVDAVNALPDGSEKSRLLLAVQLFQSQIKIFAEAAKELKTDIANLANKIVI